MRGPDGKDNSSSMGRSYIYCPSQVTSPAPASLRGLRPPVGLIRLPPARSIGGRAFRLLVNQLAEALKFDAVDLLLITELHTTGQEINWNA